MLKLSIIFSTIACAGFAIYLAMRGLLRLRRTEGRYSADDYHTAFDLCLWILLGLIAISAVLLVVEILL